MLHDIAHFWVALVIAFALGCGVRWWTRSQDQRSGTSVRHVGGPLFVVGLVLAIFHALTGRPGLWLESALLLFAAYLSGYVAIGYLAVTPAFPGEMVAASTSARSIATDEKPARSNGTSIPPRRVWMILPAAAIALLSTLLLSAAYVRRRFGSAGRRPPP